MDRWLAAALDYVPRWIEHQMRLSEQPGCVIAVAHKGQVLLERAYGYADQARGIALTPRNLKYANLEVFLKKWQNPHEADKLLQIEKDLHDVKEIIHKNLADLLKKGEQLDELMVKSKDLNKVSVEFYKKAKKQNSKCCGL